MQTIGDRLRDLRKAQGLTLQAAAAVAGTTKQSMSQIEKGQTQVPGAVALEAWARFYGVNLQWLTTGEGPREAPRALTSDSYEVRPDFSKISGAITVLKEYIEIVGAPAEWVHDSVLLEVAYELVDEYGKAVTRSNVIDLTKKLGKRIRTERITDEQRKDQDLGSEVRGAN